MLNFESEAKSLRLRPKGPDARGYKAEAVASRPVWHWGFNISGADSQLQF